MRCSKWQTGAIDRNNHCTGCGANPKDRVPPTREQVAAEIARERRGRGSAQLVSEFKRGALEVTSGLLIEEEE